MRSFILATALFFGLGSGTLQAQYFGTPTLGGGVMPAGFPGAFGGPGFGFGMSNYPFYPAGYTVSGPIIFPGFGSPGTPARMRPTVYPAIPLPSNEIIAARLEGKDGNRASINLVLPSSNARVWLQGSPMSQSGTKRHFVTPPLEEGTYTLQVRVEWDTPRGPESRIRNISVSSGSERTLTIR